MKSSPAQSRRKRRPKVSEEGYILVAVMFMLALLIISMAVALPKVTADIQRDREVETMRRGLQYRRAIQLYFKKFHTYPPNVEVLYKTNEMRFLRKKYIDPTTGKNDWKPVMMGMNKTPMAMGFFGQPLAGIGTSPGGGIMPGSAADGSTGIAGASSIGGTGATSTFGSSSFGSSTTGSSTTGSIFAPTNTGAPTDSSQTGSPSTGTTDANGNPTDPNATGTQLGGVAGSTFGGAGIVGFTPASPKQSILVYKKKNHYNEWEFLYSPMSDQMILGGGSTNLNQPSTSGTGNSGTTFSPSQGQTTTTPTPSPTPTPQQ